VAGIAEVLVLHYLVILGRFGNLILVLMKQDISLHTQIKIQKSFAHIMVLLTIYIVVLKTLQSICIEQYHPLSICLKMSLKCFSMSTQ
jgi:hypothetical protein